MAEYRKSLAGSITPEMKREVIRRLRSGSMLVDLSKEFHVAKSTIWNIAKEAGVSFKKGRPGPKHGAAKPAVTAVAADMSPEQFWRGQAANARWRWNYGGRRGYE